MPSAASAAPNVTQKPQTNTGICGYWISLYVGVISSSVTANRRTRATSHSPSTPAAASAGSGRCQNSSTFCLFVVAFVWRRLSPSTRPLSIRTDGHVTTQRHSAFGVGNVYGFVSCSCGRRCRYSKQPVATVCAPDDISAPCSALEAECDCGFFAFENAARGPPRRPESFMHVASALQRARPLRCLGAVPRI